MRTADPETFDPWKLAASGGRVQAEVPLGPMERLESLILPGSGAWATVVLAGAVDEAGWSVLDGEVSATVSMVCQRCLEPVSVPLHSRVLLGLVRAESDAVRLPETYDPVVVEDDRLGLARLAEDELILTLPVVATHPDLESCQANGYTLPTGDGEPGAGRRPFAGLGSLLQKSKTEE